MTLHRIKIVDIDHNNKITEVEHLTSTGAKMLIEEAEQLLSELKDKMYSEEEYCCEECNPERNKEERFKREKIKNEKI